VTTSFTPFTDFSSGFRRDTITEIISAAAAGKNIQLVGPVGSGKSLLSRSLASNTTDSRFTFIYIDLNLIPEKNPQSIISFLQPYFSLNPVRRTVVIFDAFLDISSPDLASVHNWLYSQFNSHRHQLSYIFSVDLPLIDPERISQFHNLDQLLCERMVYLKPLSREDAFWFIDANLAHLGKTLTLAHKENIIKLSGGYMQTIKRLIEAEDDYLTDVHLNYHLEKLYRNLKPVLDNSSVLQKMGLVDQKGQFTNLIFADFVRRKATPTPTPVTESLTAAELKAYRFLLSHPNQICSREDLISAIWGSSLHPEASDHALDQLVHRLKTKLTKSEAPGKLETVRGRGHRLNSISSI
jgi:ABC-type dipeptide/oligopeptide/nickel transport system ATPase subunit